jgi:hypothetical protein
MLSAKSNWSLFPVLLMLAGCNRNPYELSPVHGAVVVNNKPMFQGRVMFAPVAKGDEINPGKIAMGKIDSEGNYRLTTLEPDDGAIVGEHWVTVINFEEELPDGVPEFARVMVPEKAQVVAGKDNKIDIRLTRDQIRKYREDDR